MSKRTIKKQYPAVREDIADLQTHRALPTEYIEYIDPFLFLNHHGPQNYSPNNRGLPFGPHPHRGFETVTFILEGDIAHKDSAGHEEIINAGGIQWMTAGSGLVHSEVSSDEFKKSGGPLEILQLWLNLPSQLKMTKPHYVGLQREQIPSYENGMGASVSLISGKWNGNSGAVRPLVDIDLMTISLKENGKITLSVPKDRNIFFYVVRGGVDVQGEKVFDKNLVEFNQDGEELEVSSDGKSLILFGHALPLNEAVVSYGPFVMNTRQEIEEAIKDYQAGRLE